MKKPIIKTFRISEELDKDLEKILKTKDFSFSKLIQTFLADFVWKEKGGDQC